MKLRFTGTLYGDCKVKKKSSRDFRRCASLLIDDRLLMDATADLTDFIDFYGFPDLRQEICAVLISAADPKFLSADTLLYLSRGRELSVYGPPEVAALLPPAEGLRFFPIRPFSMTDVLDYKVFALPTDTPGEYNYAVCRDRAILCLPHGGILPASVLRALCGVHFDLLVANCPLLDAPPTEDIYRCGSLTVWRLMRAVLLSSEILSERSRFLLTSLPTDKKRPIHDEMTVLAAEEKMTVASDGYFLTF